MMSSGSWRLGFLATGYYDRPMPLGLYLSVPFCRTKCSFCNFASGVFSRDLFERYIRHLEKELARADKIAFEMGGRFERQVDSVYLGGGTPSVLAPDQLCRLFEAVRQNFSVEKHAEITVEVAPGTLSQEILKVLLDSGVNRASLGMQSFVDQETRSVGRLHTREITLRDITTLRENGITEISLDLIAGLPHQTADSWRYSLDETIATEVPHVSVYMLEVDEDSRLGKELIAGGTRYHAHFVPNDDATADFYLEACERLNSSGVKQYEISNFARKGHQSRHNLKYWERKPYMGFGVDAHSMLSAPTKRSPHGAVRFSTTDNLDALLAGGPLMPIEVDENDAIEEVFFLGLRLNRGVDLTVVADQYGRDAVERYTNEITELHESGLVELKEGWLRLTARGRLLSNEVFERFLED
jgi:oxygen-independent coproporphyrinogen-3 oxidase